MKYIKILFSIGVTLSLSLPSIAYAASATCNIPHYQNIISKLHSQLDAIGELKLQAEVTLETYQPKTAALATDDNASTTQDLTNPKVLKFKKILENSLKNKIKKINLSNSNISFAVEAATESEKQFSKEAEDIFNNSQIRSTAILEILKDTNKIALTINSKPTSDTFEEMARANDTSSLIVAATALIQQEFETLEANLTESVEKLESACKESKKIKIQKIKAALPENTRDNSTASAE